LTKQKPCDIIVNVKRRGNWCGRPKKCTALKILQKNKKPLDKLLKI
jgi:hypothetical protein